MSLSYVKDYKDKELRQYITVYFLVAVGSAGAYALSSPRDLGTLSMLLEIITIDFFLGALSVLVIILNELWSDKAKAKIVYKVLPSETIFSKIAKGEVDASDFDLEKAREKFSCLAQASGNKQSAEWNLLLHKSKDNKRGNVIEAQRMQLMTRDMCVSTMSLFLVNMVACAIAAVLLGNICEAIKLFGIPLTYLAIMFFITREAARNRAQRLVMLVIKDSVQG